MSSQIKRIYSFLINTKKLYSYSLFIHLFEYYIYSSDTTLTCFSVQFKNCKKVLFSEPLSLSLSSSRYFHKDCLCVKIFLFQVKTLTTYIEIRYVYERYIPLFFQFYPLKTF